MTVDDDLRDSLRELAASLRELAVGQRDLAASQREQARRLDGISSRQDDFERMLGAVTLQTSLTAGAVVDMRAKLASLDTAKWNETSRKVDRLQGAGRWFRKRGVAVAVAILGGASSVKILELLFH